MTAQARERLLYKGEEIGMDTEPLNQYLWTKKSVNFVSGSTSCWRGYYGKWEIKGNKLYIVGLKGYIKNYKEVNLKYLFPEKEEVFANWFTGEIRIPTGKMLEYIHMGYESRYEKDIILEFQEGILISEKEIDNR